MTTTTTTRVEDVPPIGRAEAAALTSLEHQRVLGLLRSLDDDDWTRPTACTEWDVRALSGHLLGAMEGFGSVRALVHLGLAARRAAGDGDVVDGMTAVQVAERADLTRRQLLDRMEAAAPRTERFRARVPALVRRARMRQDVGGTSETWTLAYLLDVILLRDAWMHRMDVAEATDRTPVLTADHDGRIVADVVAEWARRHARPFTLHLTGPAGGTFTGAGAGAGATTQVAGEELTLDAVAFCRILSGRAEGHGLLTQEVPF
jgi:uncharacterized protein (TIGR03083 family)